MWVDAFGFEDRYQVTECGRIRRKSFITKRFGRNIEIKEREIKGSIDRNGYVRIDKSQGKIRKNGKSRFPTSTRGADFYKS